MDIFGNYNYYARSANNLLVGTIICIILAFAGGIVLYCTFLSKKNNGRFTGFLGWLYDTLSFNSLLLEMLLKICYLITAGFITLYSIVLLFTPGAGFLVFIVLLVLGNILVRIAYEFMLMLIIITRNTSDLNKKLGGSDGSSPSFGPASYKPNAPRQQTYQPYQQPNAPQQPSYQQPSAYDPPAFDPPAFDPPAPPPFTPPQPFTPPPPAAPQPFTPPQPAAEQAQFCAECGSKLDPGSVFCPNCGKRQD